MRGLPQEKLIPALALVLAPGILGAEETPPDAVLVDGIAALAGSEEADESEVVLLSDVRLVAAILLLRREGPEAAARPLDAGTLQRARRTSVLIRILARRGAQLGESARVEDVRRLTAELERRAGGPAALTRLLEAHGADGQSLAEWAARTLVAARQLDYQREQVDPPSERELSAAFAEGGHAFAGGEFEAVRDDYRRLVFDEQARAALRRWLGELLDVTPVRVHR